VYGRYEPCELSASPLPLVVGVGLSPGVEDAAEKSVKEDDVYAPVAEVVEVLHVAVVGEQQVDAGIVGVTERLEYDSGAIIVACSVSWLICHFIFKKMWALRKKASSI